MTIRKALTLKRLWLLPLLTGGLALAAVLFDPDLVNSTTKAIQPVGYVGSPTASGYALTGSQDVYVIDYSSADWSGDLRAYAMSSSGALATADSWGNGAAYQIDNQNYDTGRYIVTMNGNAKIPFRWGNLSPAQKTALDAATAASATASPVLDYMRGQRSNEAPNGLGYRKRGSVLGDIIHSTPLHWNDGTNRTVFVGANDGMLHAINATNGSERFAYIPSLLISKLPDLKVSPYSHRYFVDGQLTARKYAAYTDSGGTARTAQSILVGGLGGGGKGLFALDVGAIPTTEADAASKILWEITSASTGFANLGHTYGTPVLTTLPNGDAALIVANGYNNTGNGRSSLFVINPHTGVRIAEIDTGTGSVASPNGLSSPTVVDVDFNGRADYIYAGDLNGNLWKFDLSAAPNALSATTPTQLFPTSTATQTSPAQAITMAPGYKDHPLGGRVITFATGKIFTAADELDTATHYAYGIWDRPAAYAANDTLLAQTLTEASYTGVTPAIRVRTASSNVPDWTPGAGHHMGWKTPLATSSPATTGERVVGDGAYVTGSVFLFMATNPTIAPTATPPGANWWMQLNALTGGDNGLVRFDLNADTRFTTTDQVSGVSPVGRFMGGGVRSQLTAFTTAGFDIYQANYDRNGDPPSTTSTTERGVAGGHFDQDVYYGTDLLVDSKGKIGSTKHLHEYDDIYDVTGVNMLDASSTIFDLGNAIPSTSTQFKVIASNQYLSPAVNIHLNGSPSYVYNLDQGYVPMKNFITSATLDVTSNTQVPTYTRATVNSLAINMPVDAFTPKDWWGGALGLAADVRVGLHPTQTGCVTKGTSTDGGNMYQPITPPARVLAGGTVTATGNGTLPSPRTSGVRHNGALTIQVIKATTPNSAIEMSIPGSPEYGWRVKSADYATYVLAQYTTFWHEKLIGACYGETGWTKTAATDTRACGTSDTATTRKCATNVSSALGTDPKIGSFGAATAGTTTSTVTNADGTTTTTVVVTVLNADGSYTRTTTITNSGGGSSTSTSTSNLIEIGGAVDASGTIGGGVTTPLEALGRVNWRELRR